jgi:hypothetical protein
MPFQRHSCPGPDFCSGNALFAVFSRNFLLETAFLPFSTLPHTSGTREHAAGNLDHSAMTKILNF